MAAQLQRAEDVMSTPVKSVAMSAPLREVVERLEDEAVAGLLVLDGRGQPVGVISHADVVGYMAGVERGLSGAGAFYLQAEPRRDAGTPVNLGDLEEDALRVAEAGSVMSAELITVPARARLADVARLMLERRIHRVLVERDDAIVGIVSAFDLLRALAAHATPRRKRASRAT